jgi:hypothetical protein
MTFSLMLHENVHQATDERGTATEGRGHVQPFLDEARRIAEIAGWTIPTEHDLSKWPVCPPPKKLQPEKG